MNKLAMSGVIFVAAITGAAYYFLIYAPAHCLKLEEAFVLPPSATVVDTPAEIRLDIEQVNAGDKVYVINRTRNWAQLRLADGKTGWLELKDLLDANTYERGQQQLRSMEKIPPQAAGHTSNEVNLRLEPSRDSAQLGLLGPKEHLEIFGRQYVNRAPKDASSPVPGASTDASSATALRDAWYLVRAGTHGGWVLGRFITLDVPPEISDFAQGVNTVAWLVLDTMNDDGRKVPQYLVADRNGTQEFDFNHIRVFTWWPKEQHYVTAYVESKVNGFFPIRVARADDKPYFRLRLVDKKGNKFQKIYGMFDTIVRPVGKVDGWESDAMPAVPVRRSKRRP